MRPEKKKQHNAKIKIPEDDSAGFRCLAFFLLEDAMFQNSLNIFKNVFTGNTTGIDRECRG